MGVSNLQDLLHAGGAVIAIFGIIYLVILGFYIWGFVRIMKQAGHSPHWAWLFAGFLLVLIPIVGALLLIPLSIAIIVLYFMFAFKEWPVRRELRELRAWANAQYQQQSGGGYPPSRGYPQQGGFPQSGGFPQPGQQSGGFPQQGGPQSGGFPPQQGGPQY